MTANDGRPIDTAPRDGTLISVWAGDFGPFPMRWNNAGFNPLVSKQPGIWETEDPEMATWCEDDGFGPTHWAPHA